MKNGEQLNSEINFFYNDSKTTIQCLKNQSMKEIFKTISSQKNLDYNSLSFLYFEEEINQELSFPTEEINSSGTSSEDSEENREEYKKEFIGAISFNDNLLNKGKLINHNINEFI